MLIENSFEVNASRQQAWDLLMDVPRVVPCMPGATLTDTVDESNWKAEMAVKLGPISLKFATDIERSEVDDAASTVVLKANAREMRGRGGAQADIHSTLTDAAGKTRIDIATELSLSGAVAQYGRGIVHDVSARLVRQFADCLEAQLVGSQEEAEAAVEQAAKPVAGASAGMRALGAAIGRFFRKLTGRAES